LPNDNLVIEGTQEHTGRKIGDNYLEKKEEWPESRRNWKNEQESI